MRQLAIALISYAGQNKGAFPPNSGESGHFWYLEPIIGPHITAPDKVGRAGTIPAGADPSVGLAGGVFVCPDDLEESVRSYSMNLYASGAVSSGVKAKLESETPPGRLFKHGAGRESSHLLLIVESWSELPVNGTNPLKHTAQAIVGLVGKPGERFGAGKGIVWSDPPDATPDRFDARASQIAFNRHRRKQGVMVDPRGAANFGFVDGHVELLKQEELVDRATGRSSYRAVWSPLDRVVDAAVIVPK